MIYIGTCGYSYKDWVGPVYPAGTRDANMLEHYCALFDFVEINSSFYHMPRLQLFESIVKRTPDRFRTAVKLFQGFTHMESPDEKLAEGFSYSIQPLLESGRLLCLLAQFPYSFHHTPENLDRLKLLRQWFPHVPINVEFRNSGWIRPEVAELLKKEDLGFVCVDEPKLKGLLGKILATTSQISYLRLHGRNAEKWYGGEGSERYDYLYGRNELMEWIPGIAKFEQNSALTVIAFNNHPRGQAVENAHMMADILK